MRALTRSLRKLNGVLLEQLCAWKWRGGIQLYDLLFGGGVFFLAAVLAVLFFSKIGYSHFYQSFTPESVIWACGHPFAYPKVDIKQLGDFAWGSAREFDCNSLGSPELYESVGLWYRVQPYLTWLVAILWRTFGVSYTSLIPLVSVLYGLYAAGVYAVSRSFFRFWLASLATLFLVFSPVALGMVNNLRDFSKAPFFIWAVFFLVVSIRAGDSKNRIVTAALSGVVVGIGYGFRTDLIVLVPIAIVVLFLSPQLKFWNRDGFNRMGSIVASVAFVVCFSITAAPVLIRAPLSGASGTFIMQGATEPFRISAGLEAAGYSLGWAYSDELTMSGVAASLRGKTLGWDDSETANVPGLDISKAISKSSAHLMGWLDLFAADFIAQSINSARLMLGFPLFVERYKLGTFLKGNLPEHSWVRVSAVAYSFLGKGQIVFYIVILGALALLYRSYVKSKREALCFLVLFGSMVAYPGLQFDPRHAFHLEFIWVICLLSFISFLFERCEWENLPSFVGYVVAGCGLVGVIYLSAIQYQRHFISAEVKNLMALPRQQVTSSEQLLENGGRYFRVDVPENYKLLTVGESDSMTPKIANIGAEWDVRAAADRLLVHVEGEACDFSRFRAVAKYSHSKDIWQPLDVELKFLKAPNSSRALLLFPAFYRPTQFFDGLFVSKEFANCNVSIERLLGESSLPFVFTANIEGKNILGRSYKKISPFGLTITEATISKKFEGKL